MSDIVKELSDLAAQVSALAVAAGADDAEVLIRDGSELTTKVRMGEPELVQEAGSRALGLRVFKDRRAALTYTSDLRLEALKGFAADSVALAEISEPDELNTLPDAADLATDIPALDLYDSRAESLQAGEAIERAIAGEKAAFAYDGRITNSEGATYSRVLGSVAFATSAGFSGGYRGSYSSLYVEPICEDADGKKRNGHWWTASRFVADLDDPEAVGREAARRTIAQLGADKIETGERAVVFDAEAARSILGTFFGVANGSAFYRKSSYLLGRENERVASELVTIEDDPLIPRGPGSRPFDGDGLATRKNLVVEKGILRTVLCDTYTARKLGRKSTASAGRGIGGSPGPTSSNFIMRAGSTSRDDIIKESEGALYVTGMMGFGFNGTTGDFSRGAFGFLIENGALGRPVTEVTISANFDDILQRIDLVGSDLDLRTSTAAPTFRVSRMTIAGR